MAGTINYYSAPQANIYINGILVDECYDIQYSYRESKEPIYGYLSKFYDAIVDGTVIITGSFTINYKHDQYLTQVLKKATGESTFQKSDGTAYKNNKRNSYKDLEKFNADYKNALLRYSEALKKKKELAEKLDTADKNKNSASETYNADMIIWNGKLDALNLELGNKESLLNLEYEKEIPDQLILDTLYSEMENIQSQIDQLVISKPENSNINELEKIRATAQTEFNSMSPAKIIEELQIIKANISQITVTDGDLQSDVNSSKGWKRPEDIKGAFTIEFNYNGTPHKRIEGCSILGHAHPVGQGGTPIKEAYTFVGRKFSYQ